MPLYCMCNTQAGQFSGAPNRYCKPLDWENDDFPAIALRKRMDCIKMGANQVILDEKDNKDYNLKDPVKPAGRIHFPNVDIFECPYCHARVVKE